MKALKKFAVPSLPTDDCFMFTACGEIASPDPGIAKFFKTSGRSGDHAHRMKSEGKTVDAYLGINISDKNRIHGHVDVTAAGFCKDEKITRRPAIDFHSALSTLNGSEIRLKLQASIQKE